MKLHWSPFIWRMQIYIDTLMFAWVLFWKCWPWQWGHESVNADQDTWQSTCHKCVTHFLDLLTEWTYDPRTAMPCRRFHLWQQVHLFLTICPVKDSQNYSQWHKQGVVEQRQHKQDYRVFPCIHSMVLIFLWLKQLVNFGNKHILIIT